jgi:hypothetical protein
VEFPAFRMVANRFVEEAVVANEFVEVALVVVALSPVKFCSVEDARERKPPVKVESPVTDREPRVPTDVRDEERTFEAKVAPVSVPAGAVPVMFPVRLPVALVKKRLVVDAVVAKKFVEVALVVVEFPEMTRLALIVDEAWTMMPLLVEVGER